MARSRRLALFRPGDPDPAPAADHRAAELADAPARRPGGHVADGCYVGRVPVLDHREDLAGYQLVVERLDGAGGPAPAGATITGALLEVGLDSLIGGRLGFVSVPPSLVVEGLHHALPPERMVIELDPDAEGDPAEAARLALEAGYHVAAPAGAKWTQSRASRDLLSTVVIDARTDDPHWASIRVGRQHPNARLLADGVDDRDLLGRCWAAGCWWARGTVVRRPDRVAEPTVPAQRLAVLELLSRIEDPRAKLDDIDELVSVDLGISYRLLRLANSSFLALERRVESTRDAIVFLGLDTVRAVAALMTMAATTDRPPALATLGLVRARTCQELADRHDRGLRRAAFTAGLLSTLDELLGLDVDQVLDRMPVSDEIAEALRGHAGTLGQLLEVAIALDEGDVARLRRGDVPVRDLTAARRAALVWSAALEKEIEPWVRTLTQE